MLRGWAAIPKICYRRTVPTIYFKQGSYWYWCQAVFAPKYTFNLNNSLKTQLEKWDFDLLTPPLSNKRCKEGTFLFCFDTVGHRNTKSECSNKKYFFVSYLGILWTLTTQPFIWCTQGSQKENVGIKCFFSLQITLELISHR